MNVLLIQPDIDRTSLEVRDAFPSVGPNMLATELRTQGHSVRVIDPFMVAIKISSPPANLCNLVEDAFATESVDLLGVSLVIQTRLQSVDLARRFKLLHPHVPIVLGGPGASLLAPLILAEYPGCIDCIVTNEGDETFPAVVDALERGRPLCAIPGVVLPEMSGEKSAKWSAFRPPIPNLDTLPFPDYAEYLKILPGNNLGSACVLMSRGCRYDCPFCGTRAMWGAIRYRSATHVFSEILQLHDRFGVTDIRFHDDTFGENSTLAKSILQSIIDKRLGLSLYAHTRTDVVDMELLRLFKRAGGETLYYGVESGSERIRRAMGKSADATEILGVCRATKELGINVGVFVMLGYPGETAEDVKQTFELLRRIDAHDVQCSITKMQPGTRLYESIEAEEDDGRNRWLKNQREYFVYADKEREDVLKGCELLLYEAFSRESCRTPFEKNNDVQKDSSRSSSLRRKALDFLGVV